MEVFNDSFERLGVTGRGAEGAVLASVAIGNWGSVAGGGGNELGRGGKAGGTNAGIGFENFKGLLPTLRGAVKEPGTGRTAMEAESERLAGDGEFSIEEE